MHETRDGTFHRFGEGIGGKFVLPIFRIEMLFNPTNQRIALTADFRIREVVVRHPYGYILWHDSQIEPIQGFDANGIIVFVAEFLLAVFKILGVLLFVVFGHVLPF